MAQSKSISLTTILLVIVAALSLILYMQNCRGVKVAPDQGINLVNALNDSLIYYKSETNRLVATISVLQTDKAKDFLVLQSKDGEVRELQQVVKDYKNKLIEGNSVTLALLETINKNSQPTVIIKTDTVWGDRDSDGYTDNYIWPTYRDSVKNKWLDYRAEMNRDSSTFHIGITNEFSAIIGNDKRGPFADIIAYNPYTTVKKLRTYQVSQPRYKAFGFGASAGVTFYNNQFNPYIGAGVNWTPKFTRF